jgi:hypothetical protein
VVDGLPLLVQLVERLDQVVPHSAVEGVWLVRIIRPGMCRVGRGVLDELNRKAKQNPSKETSSAADTHTHQHRQPLLSIVMASLVPCSQGVCVCVVTEPAAPGPATPGPASDGIT